MSGLVVGGQTLVLFIDHPAAFGTTPANFIAGFFEIGHFDVIFILHAGTDGGFVNQRLQFGTAEHRGSASHFFPLDIGAAFDLLGVDFENAHTAFEVRQRNHHLAVKPAGAGQGAVEDIGAVGCGNDNHLVVGFKAVHFNQDGIERLFAFIVAAADKAGTAFFADGVDFIEEDDARRIFLGLAEQVADAAGADADEHLDKITAGDAEKRHIRFAGNGLGQQGLAAAGRSDQQHTAGNASADFLELFGVFQELNDFGHFFLGFINTRDVGKGNLGVLAGTNAVFAAAEAQRRAQSAAASHAAQEEEINHCQQQCKRQQVPQQRQPHIGLAALDDYIMLLQEGLQLLVPHRLDINDLKAGRIRRFAGFLAEFVKKPHDAFMFNLDAFDVSLPNVIEEIGTVIDLLDPLPLVQGHQQGGRDQGNQQPTERTAIILAKPRWRLPRGLLVFLLFCHTFLFLCYPVKKITVDGSRQVCRRPPTIKTHWVTRFTRVFPSILRLFEPHCSPPDRWSSRSSVRAARSMRPSRTPFPGQQESGRS